jgi:CHAT domain-containing protein
VKSGVPHSEALRHAKLELKNSKKFSHPFYWSGFVLHGG